ncbi:MAG TPA: cation transporter [Gaiellaceae bacterium]|jgi:divalent metal cation (Fe/Co/Zn/Cd) transporter
MSTLDRNVSGPQVGSPVRTVRLQARLDRSPERERLERRARMLAWGGIAYHFVEFAIALAAGIAASSIALIGFGADSLIEALAGFVVLWLLTGARIGSHQAERRAQQLIALTFFVLAAYVGTESIRTLAGGQHPEASWAGIGLAAFTTVTMPLLARVKRRVGNQLGSVATVREASQTQLCAYLSVALLLGLVLNAVAGFWWADPLAALFIAAVAVKEGRESWRGESCCDAC